MSRLFVEVRSGPSRGKRAIVSPGGALRVGRTERADLVLGGDSHVSALHCELRLAHPPRLDIEARIANDRFYRFLERTWMAQQLPPALALYALGGWASCSGACARACRRVCSAIG